VGRRLTHVVDGVREPGVYRWRSRAHPAALRRDLSAAGWTLHRLEGQVLTNQVRLFDAFAYQLGFPAWFGRTWDAFSNCLTDLSWLPGRGHVVLWDRYGSLVRGDAEAWDQMYTTCTAAIEMRRQVAARPLYVLLRGTGSQEPPYL
jgi:hypothetical protein